MQKCIRCNKESENPKFCSRDCANKHRAELIPKPRCINCEQYRDRENEKYCSRKCEKEFQNRTYIEGWIVGTVSGTVKDGRGVKLSTVIREYLITQYGEKCSRCSWGERNKATGAVPLEIHHRDGDSSNNSESNLEVLCPNCHSLTSTFRALNKGNGRNNSASEAT